MSKNKSSQNYQGASYSPIPTNSPSRFSGRSANSNLGSPNVGASTSAVSGMGANRGIVYSLVANNKTKAILAKHSISSNDYSQVIKAIFERMPNTNSKLSYAYERNLFHYACQNGYIFLCVANEDFGRRIPFAFLKEIQSQFFTTYNIDDAGDYSGNESDDIDNNGATRKYLDFEKVLYREMAHFSRDQSTDPIRHVQTEINQVKNIMVQNIERVLERGDRIDTLVDKTNALSTNAFAFRQKSTMIRRQMWWKNQKLVFMLICCVFAAFYIIICSICGFPFWSHCRA